MKTILKVILPLVVLAAALGVAWAMYLARPAAESRAPEEVVPVVRAAAVEQVDMTLTVASQGTVEARTESTLVPEVAGRVIEVAAEFISGGFFAADQILLRIDPHDYRQAIARSQARVAEAELRLARERAEAEVAAAEWADLNSGGEASGLTLRLPQVAEAEALVAAAQADLQQARRNMERTVIRAPYAGRVRSKNVDVGQYVAPGTPLASIYAVDVAEVRLLLPDADLAFIDVPLVYRGDDGNGPRPQVSLQAEFAGRIYTWEGRVVRTEGEIDRRSRMVTVIAQVQDPYGRGPEKSRPPLAVGMFVQAEIQGHAVEDVVVIPRSALRDGERVLVVDDESRLRFRNISVLRRSGNQVIVDGGLQAGELLCLSPLVAVVDGMKVRVETVS